MNFILRKIRDAVDKAGGVLYFLTFEDRYEDVKHILDGYLIPGGRDVNPAFYNQANIDSDFDEKCSKLRHAHCSDFMAQGDKDMPILGVCYGIQFLNVYYGGTLIQMIDNSYDHHGDIRPVTVTENSHLHKATNLLTVGGVCYHHQGIDQVGKGLKVTGVDEQDGSIHSLEHEGEDRKIMSVLWHPESTIGEDGQRESSNQAIFDYFVDLAKQYRSQKLQKYPPK